jgi:2-C-methyl-D-erythritol 4-phosphate cytidylyltransferase/2-C-methyl-D-erythritol 2,4-cyclodiphosphate synthase
MSVGVIIVAGGRGARVGAGLPKQFLDIGGRTILRRAIDAFDSHPQVDRLVVVLPSELVSDAPRFIGATSRPCHVASGGATRHDSVRLGLAAMPAGPDVILVHDAARPFPSTDLIGRVIAAAEDCGAAVPALPAGETVKRVDRDARVVRETIAREEVWLAQTPQGFRRSVLEAAIARPGGASATDEAILVERAGVPVRVVPGEAGNVKITTPDDLAAARARLAWCWPASKWRQTADLWGTPTATSCVTPWWTPCSARRRLATSAGTFPTPTRDGRTSRVWTSSVGPWRLCTRPAWRCRAST